MTPKPIELSPEERLALLQHLDRRHPWGSPADQRLCLGCGKLITGWRILVVRAMRGLGPLRLRCPSENCGAGPLDWVLPSVAGGAEISATHTPRRL